MDFIDGTLWIRKYGSRSIVTAKSHLKCRYVYRPVALGLGLAWGKVGFPALKQVSPEKLLPTASLYT